MRHAKEMNKRKMCVRHAMSCENWYVQYRKLKDDAKDENVQRDYSICESWSKTRSERVKCLQGEKEKEKLLRNLDHTHTVKRRQSHFKSRLQTNRREQETWYTLFRFWCWWYLLLSRVCVLATTLIDSDSRPLQPHSLKRVATVSTHWTGACFCVCSWH